MLFVFSSSQVNEKYTNENTFISITDSLKNQRSQNHKRSRKRYSASQVESIACKINTKLIF